VFPTPSQIAAAIIGQLFSAIAHVVSQGIVSIASFGLSQLTHAATSTTAISFDTWFSAPWRSMLAVGGMVAIPLFFTGIVSALVKGEGPSGVGRVLGRLLGAGAGGLLALAGVQLVLALVDASCAVVEHGSGISLPSALARLGTALGVDGAVTGGIGGVLLALLAALAALVLWLELAVRSALILVATAFVPLALAGLLWPATSSWLRRLTEVIIAVAVSKLVIVVVLILGAAAIFASPLSVSSPGADIDAMVSGVAFLALATLGLPMALRLVPMAAEAAIAAGIGSMPVKRAARATTTVASYATTQGLLRAVNGGRAAASAGASAAAGNGSSPGPSGPGRAVLSAPTPSQRSPSEKGHGSGSPS